MDLQRVQDSQTWLKLDAATASGIPVAQGRVRDGAIGVWETALNAAAIDAAMIR